MTRVYVQWPPSAVSEEPDPCSIDICAVIATIGPASQSVEVLCKMLEAGMTCIRLDLTVRPGGGMHVRCRKIVTARHHH